MNSLLIACVGCRLIALRIRKAILSSLAFNAGLWKAAQFRLHRLDCIRLLIWIVYFRPGSPQPTMNQILLLYVKFRDQSWSGGGIDSVPKAPHVTDHCGELLKLQTPNFHETFGSPEL